MEFKEQLIEWRHTLHTFPEAAFEEKETVAVFVIIGVKIT